jgi:leader peptidase (prepilin peptidase) / N-methyltransferase
MRTASFFGELGLSALVVGLIGLPVGCCLGLWLERLSRVERTALQWPLAAESTRRIRFFTVVVLTALLFGALYWAEHGARVLDTDEVQPSWLGREMRLYYHLVLMSLLIVATAIDFDCYMIPDRITFPGMFIGILGAVVFGDLQLCHLWVDWSVAIPQLRGPIIPAWYDAHHHWHGLAWSSAGLVTGAGLTWLARAVSSRVIGQEAMGFGDVTLMAMIGSFIGWQAVVLVFLLAPLAGLSVGIVIKLATGKSYLPYGPWLSIAATYVLFQWGWLWSQTRVIFSDWLSLTVLAGIGSVCFVLLLGLTRLYRAIPIRS